jgi:hypothetical protein
MTSGVTAKSDVKKNKTKPIFALRSLFMGFGTVGAVYELEEPVGGAIAPPGQEGWREAPGWLSKKILLNNHLVCAE